MVFVDYSGILSPGTGMIAVRDTGKNAALLCIECLFGTLVAFSNLLVIVVMIAGRLKLLKNNFYIIVANLISFTSMKAFVELAFILPYYIMRSDRRLSQGATFFSTTYDFLIFSLSVFADYGVLFFSVLIAANRLFAVRRKDLSKTSRVTTVISCAFVWLCSAIIPIIFFVCKCQYSFNFNAQMYVTACSVKFGGPEIAIVIDCLVYVSYACSLITLIIYLLIFRFLRQKREQNYTHFNRTSPQMRLLRQSFVVFVLYAASIIMVLGLSFLPQLGGTSNPTGSSFYSDLIYVENLLNLSIAGVYPICFLSMSGEMRSVLISKILPARSDQVASISLNNNNNNNKITSNGLGLIASRDMAKNVVLLFIESLFGTVVAVSNIIIITVMIAGWKKLMKNNFYIVVANLIVCTSLKAVVELAFILPYYILRSDKMLNKDGTFFTATYDFFIFCLSVFADYGVLFFSLLIAVNRLYAVTRRDLSKISKVTTAISCIFVWIFTCIIPIIFFSCKCQYAFDFDSQMYVTVCAYKLGEAPMINTITNCLVYLSYACSLIAFCIYLLIFRFLRQKRKESVNFANFHRTSPQMRLIRQSFVVFILYAASIALVLILSFLPLTMNTAKHPLEPSFVSDMVYAENLLNLSIAAVCPICFLFMSGEMKSVLVSKILPIRSHRIASISVNNQNNNNNHSPNNNNS